MVKGRHLIKVVSDSLFNCLDMVAVKVVVLWSVITKKICPAFHKKSLFIVSGMGFIVVAVSKIRCLLFLFAVQSLYSLPKSSGVFVNIELRSQLVPSVLL